jgi:hypothetical protein
MNKNSKPSATQILVEQMITLLSKHSSQQKSDYVKRGMLNRVESGYSVTRPPFGYSKGEIAGVYEINKQGRAVHKILSDFASDNLDVQLTIDSLISLFGTTTNKCEQSAVTKIEQLVSNPYYLGYIRHDVKMYQGQHEPLFSREEHMKFWQLVCYLEMYIDSKEPIDKNILNNYNGSMSRKKKNELSDS